MAEKEKYIIKVQDTLVEVTEDVYLAYYRMERQAKGLEEKDRYHNTIPYDALDTDEMLGIESIADKEVTSIEDEAITRMMGDRLHSSLASLPESAQTLIYQRYWEGLSQSELAKEYGISQQALSRREQRILSKLRNILKM